MKTVLNRRVKMHSHKNTSKGGHEGKGNSGADYSKIKENVDPKPPAGASNSYEKVREKIDRKDDSHLAKRSYTREKMANK